MQTRARLGPCGFSLRSRPLAHNSRPATRQGARVKQKRYPRYRISPTQPIALRQFVVIAKVYITGGFHATHGQAFGMAGARPSDYLPTTGSKEARCLSGKIRRPGMSSYHAGPTLRGRVSSIPGRGLAFPRTSCLNGEIERRRNESSSDERSVSPRHEHRELKHSDLSNCA